MGPSGPRPPSGGGGFGVVLAIAAAFLLVIGGGAAVFFLFGDDDDDDLPSRRVAVPTYPTLPTYRAPSYSPPTFSPPSIPTPTYSPRLNYGAIAVGRDGSIGKAWDYSTESGARARALRECPASTCKVLTTFVNGCGAVAFNPKTNKYWGGRGSTRAAAQANAISNAGGGRNVTWVCTTR